MRPGELLAIQRKNVKSDSTVIEVRRRVYRGKFAVPKNGLIRKVAVPPETASLLQEWMEMAVDPNPEAYVFAGETGQPLWRSSLLEDHIRAKLKTVGLAWVNFQVMRRHPRESRARSESRSEGLGGPAWTWHRRGSRCVHQIEY